MSDTTTTVDTETLETPSTEVDASVVEVDTPPAREGGKDRRNNNDHPRRDRRDATREEPKEFQEELLGLDRVTRVTAGGRQLRFRASIVIGDGKGRVGLGTGKSGEVQGAIEKAVRDAKKNLIQFPIIDGTIPHDVAVNYKASSLFLHPAHPGTGIIAGGAVRKLFAVSGIKDIIAKQHGAPNGITNARVAFKALASLKPVSQMRTFAKKNSDSTEKAVSATTVEETTPTPKKAPAKKPAAPKKAPAKKKAE